MPPAVDAAPQPPTAGSTGRRPPTTPNWVQRVVIGVVMWCPEIPGSRADGPNHDRRHKCLGSKRAGCSCHRRYGPVPHLGLAAQASQFSAGVTTPVNTRPDATGASGPPAAEPPLRRQL